MKHGAARLIVVLLALCRIAPCQGEWANDFTSIFVDRYIANCRDVVVARMTSAPIVKRDETVRSSRDGDRQLTVEGEVELQVLRVIRGRAKVGLMKVLTNVHPDPSYPPDYTQPMIWALEPTLCLSKPKGPIYPYSEEPSPLAEAPFIDAAGNPMGSKFKQLLTSDLMTKVRALYFIAGGSIEPSDSDKYSPIRALKNEVIAATKDPEFKVREAAINALGRVATRQDAPIVRPLLLDPNEDVRCIAAAVLLLWHDIPSLEKFKNMLPYMWINFGPTGILRYSTPSKVTCDEAILTWNSPVTIPLLLRMLDDPTELPLFWSIMPQQNLAAILAANKLKTLTGFTFPFNSKVAVEIWDQAQRSQNPKASLEAALKPYQGGLSAYMSKRGSNWLLKIKNNTERPFSISSAPLLIYGGYYHGFDPLDMEELPGGSAMYFDVTPGEFLPGNKIIMRYSRLPDRPQTGWVGEFEVRCSGPVRKALRLGKPLTGLHPDGFDIVDHHP